VAADTTAWHAVTVQFHFDLKLTLLPCVVQQVLAKGGTLALSPGQCMHTTLHCAAQASREAHSEVAGAGLLP